MYLAKVKPLIEIRADIIAKQGNLGFPYGFHVKERSITMPKNGTRIYYDDYDFMMIGILYPRKS